jgi:nitrate/nitrite transporter NarK
VKNNETLYALIIWYLIVAGAFFAVLMAFIYLLNANYPIKYDCTISEFSPDFTQKMKEECLRKKTN